MKNSRTALMLVLASFSPCLPIRTSEFAAIIRRSATSLVAGSTVKMSSSITSSNTSDDPTISNHPGDTAQPRQFGVLESISMDRVQLKLNGNTNGSNLLNSDKTKLLRLFLDDDGKFPNNPHHPVVILQQAFAGTRQEGEQLITAGHQWTAPWIWGIFEYHHYHSTAWELLLCISGSAHIQLGGPTGPTLDVTKRDLLLIPPGVAHIQLRASADFALLGSYPTAGNSGRVDTLRGKPTPPQRHNIATCIPPTTEPILGLDMSLFYE